MARDPSDYGYARDPKLDRAGLINPGEVAARSLCALLRIEDLLIEIRDRLPAAGDLIAAVPFEPPAPTPRAAKGKAS